MESGASKPPAERRLLPTPPPRETAADLHARAPGSVHIQPSRRLTVRPPGGAPGSRHLGADIVGVRGSACEGGRAGTGSAVRVRALHTALVLSASMSPAFDHP